MKNKPALLLILALLFAAPLWSSAQDVPVLKNTPTLTLELASRMMEVADRRAEELNQAVSIVIVGTDGLPLMVRRHEEAPGLVYEQALQDAQAAWLDKKETAAALPVLSGTHRLGGIGVSGAAPSKNKEIGRSALEVFNETLKKKIPVQTAEKELLKIILYVRPSEMTEVADFYREAIGLQQVVAYSNWVEFEAGTANICLHEKDKNSVRAKATNFALYSGTREEVAALHARLIEDGYKVTSDINPEKDKTMGRLRHEEAMTTFWIKDPAGNTVQIESLRTR